MIFIYILLLHIASLKIAIAACLVENELSVSSDKGKIYSNIDELLQYDFESWDIFAIKTCLLDGSLSGIQFTLQHSDNS